MVFFTDGSSTALSAHELRLPHESFPIIQIRLQKIQAMQVAQMLFVIRMRHFGFSPDFSHLLFSMFGCKKEVILTKVYAGYHFG
jgi:hypothetical protein